MTPSDRDSLLKEEILEAANWIEDFRAKKPNVPWKQIAGMRDILVHDYTEVDRAAVWEAATKNMPELLKELD